MSSPRVLYEDNHLLVLEKPACLPCVPDASEDPSLLDWGKRYVKEAYDKPGAVFLGVVHRLDRPVSGVVLFARTSKAAERLAAQFRERAVEKIYLGVVTGPAPAEGGSLEQWLTKDAESNRVHVATEGEEGARSAVTEWRALERRGDLTLLELKPRTGRPHQLRVACKSLGAPLAGDLKYGADEPLPDKSIALHAAHLAVDHPTRDERLEFHSSPPDVSVWQGWSL